MKLRIGMMILILFATMSSMVALGLGVVLWQMTAIESSAAPPPRQVSQSGSAGIQNVPGANTIQMIETERYQVAVTETLRGLNHPWGMAILPDGDWLITERYGGIKRFNPQKNSLNFITNMPESVQEGQGGLLDIVLSPDFGQDNLVYLSYAAPVQGSDNPDNASLRVMRARLVDNRLSDSKILFDKGAVSDSSIHFGGRMVFDCDGKLVVTLGERGNMAMAQQPDVMHGRIIRIDPTGETPFEVISMGHRNPQGLALAKPSCRIWESEHGPRGGDEINLIEAGKNYGWPVITYGIDYDGSVISTETHKDGMEQPRFYFVPSPALAGMGFYNGKMFPDWRGNLFVTALAGESLFRLVIEDDNIIHVEKMLENRFGRLRNILEDRDGSLLILTDSDDGKIIRITPVREQNR